MPGRDATPGRRRPRSVRRISANRSRWPTQYMPVRMKVTTKALNDGRTSARASVSVWPLGELGDVDLRDQQGDDDGEHPVGQSAPARDRGPVPARPGSAHHAPPSGHPGAVSRCPCQPPAPKACGAAVVPRTARTLVVPDERPILEHSKATVTTSAAAGRRPLPTRQEVIVDEAHPPVELVTVAATPCAADRGTQRRQPGRPQPPLTRKLDGRSTPALVGRALHVPLASASDRLSRTTVVCRGTGR